MKLADLKKIFIWDIINPIWLKNKKNKRYKIDDSTQGINIGCGVDNPQNWLGIDGLPIGFMAKRLPKSVLRPFYNNSNTNSFSFDEFCNYLKNNKFIHHDLRYGLPFADNTIKNIYSSHFWEHILFSDAQMLLKECFRVMQNGGYIRISVPSLDYEVEQIKKAVADYENGNPENVQKYVTSDIIGYHSYYASHRYMYNFEEMQKALLNAGFSDIKQCTFKTGNIPDVEILDTRSNSLFVEGIKN